jgi:predicted secreted protein
MNPVSEQAREDVPGSVPVADTSYRGRRLLLTATVLAMIMPISSFLLSKGAVLKRKSLGPK